MRPRALVGAHSHACVWLPGGAIMHQPVGAICHVFLVLSCKRACLLVPYADFYQYQAGAGRLADRA